MSLLDFTQDKLVKGVNTANNLSIALSDVVFSKPKDNTAGIYSGGTLIRMAARGNSSIDGSTLLGYDRIPLSVLYTAVAGVLPIPSAVTDPYDALSYFHYHYGIGLSEYKLLAEFVPGNVNYPLGKLYREGFKHSATVGLAFNANMTEHGTFVYDSIADTLTMPTDATLVEGFITQESFTDYVLDITLGTDQFDTGTIGVIVAAAYNAGSTQMQTVSLDINMANGGIPNFEYNYGETGGTVISGFGTSVGSIDWATAGTRRVVITRTGNSVKADVYGFSNVQDPATIVATKTISLAAYTNMSTSARVGVLTKGCKNAQFKNFVMSYPTSKMLKLTADAENPYLMGTATFELSNSELNAGTPYMYDPSTNIVDDGRTFAELYKYPLNMTTYKTTMSAITMSTTDFKALATALRVVTGNDWKYDVAAPYSLLGAIVRKVGLRQAAWGASASYTYACVIEVSESCQSMVGNLILHFN